MSRFIRGRFRARLAVAAVAVTAAAVVGVCASPAGAILVKLPHGGYASYAALSGPKAPQSVSIFDAAFTNLDYSGGPVMPSNTNYTIEWLPSNYGGHTPFQTGYVTGVDQFFTNMAADSGKATNSDAVSTQYNDAQGHTAAYNFHNGGKLVDTDPLPANGCPAASGDICLSDTQLQSELDSFLSKNSLPADLSHEYYLITPPDVASCFDSGGTQCSANADQGQAFCAYHSQTSTGYVYSNIPDLSGVDGCDPFATYWFDCPNFSCSYNNGPADGVLSAISHEHNESITDPQPNNAWTDWGSNVGGEIGDKCNNDGINDPNLQFGGGGGDAPYNEVVNGTHYLLQREWSNQTTQCLDGFTPAATTAHAAFNSSNGSGNTVAFDASASGVHPGGVAEYVWQFNDGPGQTGTIETTSPTISHTFPAAGPYTVALTVMASDGTSNGTANPVTAGGGKHPPTAVFTAPSGAEGAPLTFNGTASTDPNAGGSISSYAWDFGDGAKGTGPTAQHAYSHYGTYTATLTVTDNYGLSSTAVSHTVVVSDESPTAAFSSSTGSALEGTPIGFNGAASSDSDGQITSYSWSFGDGTNGGGVTTSHAYAAPGTYTVTLVVTDSDGQRSSVSHSVTITDEAPTAAFTAPSGTAGKQVTFTGTGFDPDGSTVLYAWRFGDGGSASGASVGHVFAAPGTYTVTLTIVDSSGQAASVSHQVVIGVSHTVNKSCVVPKLKGKTLAQAKSALRGAHCGVGKIKQPHKPKHSAGAHKVWELVVAKQSPAPGRVETQGSKVALTLTYKAVKSHR